MWEIRAAQKSHPCGPWWIVTAKPIKVLRTTAAALVPTGKRGISGRHGGGMKQWDKMSMHSGNKSLYKPESDIP